MDANPDKSPRTPASRCRNPLARPPEARRILVVRLGALGDVVRTLPAVAALRRAYPKAHIAWLVEPAAAPLLREQALIDEVIPVERASLVRSARSLDIASLRQIMMPLWKRLRGRFDLVLDFHSILRSAVPVRFSAAPMRIGFAPPIAREGAAAAFTHRARLVDRELGRFDRNAALVEFLGVPASETDAHYRLRVSDAAAGRMSARLISLRLAAPAQPGQPAGEAAEAQFGNGSFAVLHAGTSAGARYKRWSESSFATLARGLRDRAGLHSLIASGPAAEERASAQRIADASGGAALVAPETEDTAELAALVAEACLFAGADSGPLHVASLCGTPVLQLLGPTHPVHNEPWAGTPWRRVSNPVPCSPCRRGCGNPICMSGIAPQDALNAALALLEDANVARRGSREAADSERRFETEAER